MSTASRPTCTSRTYACYSKLRIRALCCYSKICLCDMCAVRARCEMLPCLLQFQRFNFNVLPRCLLGTLRRKLADTAWAVIKEKFLSNAEWRAAFLKGSAGEPGADIDSLREHVIMGLNYPVRCACLLQLHMHQLTPAIERSNILTR